jgi:hypothetical protein
METTSKNSHPFPRLMKMASLLPRLKKKTAILKFGLRPVVSQERRGT